MDPAIDQLDHESGIEIVDPIEGVTFPLYTPHPVEPAAETTDSFTYPVDVARTIETPELTIPKYVDLLFRSDEGEQLGTFSGRQDDQTSTEYRPRQYSIQVTTAPVALYLRVDGAVEVATRDAQTCLSFPDGPTLVSIGVRSFHEEPGQTISVPPQPAAIMDAVSALGSGLKSLAVDRSFPTLRGHPPEIELDADASEVDLADVAPPETDVYLDVPADLDYVYPVAPLAYYLGARLRERETPRLVTGEATRDLDEDGFAADVGSLLSRILTLDVVVRSAEGPFQTDLAERGALEDRLDGPLDYAGLFTAPIAERVQRYLALPGDAVDAIVPQWHHTITVAPEVEHAEALPYVVHHLPRIRTPTARSKGPQPRQQIEAIDGYLRNRSRPSPPADDFLRGPEVRSEEVRSNTTPDQVVDLQPADSQTHAWLGDGYSTNTNGKLRLSSLRQRPSYDTSRPGEVSVTIVCNDLAMEEESTVEEVWFRELFEFDVSIDYDLAKDELARRLREPTDFFHYIGHVTEDGLQCADGHLDLAAVREVGMEMFLLNGCTSYEQGEALIEAGAVSGIITTTNVNNTLATEIGRALANALNAGFQLRSAMAVIQEHFLTTSSYTYLGDGGVCLVDSEAGVPYYLTIEEAERPERFVLDITTFPTFKYGVGSQASPVVSTDSTTHLAMGNLATYTVSHNQLAEYLSSGRIPVNIDGNLYWSTELSGIELSSLFKP